MSRMVKRGLVALGALLAVAVLLVGAALLAAGPLLNTGLVRERLVQAIGRATGHVARIDGPMELSGWSLAPRAVVRGLVLLNPPGFAGADFATLGEAEGRVALLPLLIGRVDVRSVRLDHAVVALERNAAGVGNWQRPAAEAVPNEPARTGTRDAAVVRRVEASDVVVSGLGLPPLRVDRMTFSPAGGPLSASLVLGGVPFDVDGKSGPVAAGSPFEAVMANAGLTVTAARAPGGPVEIKAKAAELGSLSVLAGRTLPPLRDVSLTARLGPGGPEALELNVGPGTLAPGVAIQTLQAVQAGLGQPVKVLAQLAVRALPVAVAMTVGPRLDGPVAVQVTADGGTASATGLLDGRQFTGTVTARVPDLARTGRLAGVALPPVRELQVDGRLLPAPGGAGVLVRGLRVNSAQGDLAGDLAVLRTERVTVRGSLESGRLDLSEMGAGGEAVPVPAPLLVPQGGTTAPYVAGGPAVDPGTVATGMWDRPLVLSGLVLADADLRLAVSQLVVGAATLRGVQGHVVLNGGLLRLDPVSVQGAGGTVQGAASVDGAAVPARWAVRLAGAGVGAGVLGVPGVSGTLDVDVALQAQGNTARAVATTLEGRAGVALEDGEVANELLARVFGPALRGASIPLDAVGSSRVRCLAAGMTVAGGEASVTSLALDTTRLKLDGSGALNLVDQTMDLHLRPVLRTGLGGVTVPVRVSGPWRLPRAEADRGVAVGGVAGRFGIAIGPTGTDVCGPAVTAVRQGMGR